MKKVLVLGSKYNGSFLPHDKFRVLGMNDYIYPHNKLPIYDLILFTGGGDLCPSMYGKDYPEIHGHPIRDHWEKEWFTYATEHHIPMFGICRGMQLFTALSGGELIPHVKGHFGHHNVFTTDNSLFSVNSIHHQMCVPPPTAKLLAWASGVAFKDKAPEPEALYFPDISALGVQWHPESMGHDTAAHKFVVDKIDTLLFSKGE